MGCAEAPRRGSRFFRGSAHFARDTLGGSCAFCPWRSSSSGSPVVVSAGGRASQDAGYEVRSARQMLCRGSLLLAVASARIHAHVSVDPHPSRAMTFPECHISLPWPLSAAASPGGLFPL